MRSIQQSAAVALLSAVAVLCPHISPAMTIEMYDAMAIEDRSDYLTLLVNRAHDVFVEEGQQDLAAKLDELFRTRRGEQQSPRQNPSGPNGPYSGLQLSVLSSQ